MFGRYQGFLSPVNIDSTLIAGAPNISPHREAMQDNTGAALGIPPQGVVIKATTNETMGFVGRKEGIAAMAVAMVGVKFSNQ